MEHITFKNKKNVLLRKKEILRKIFLAPIIMILTVGCGGNAEPTPQVTKQDPPKLVKVAEAKIKTLQEVLEITGTIEPENTTNIKSTGEGKVTRLHVREGDLVQEGQVVVRLSPRLREEVITAAKIKVESLEEELQTKPENESLNQLLKEARENYNFALDQYKEISIVSPSSGIISKRFIDVGDMIEANSQILEVISAGSFKINLFVAETDLKKLETGQEAKLNLDACPDQQFTGTITRIYPEVDELSRNGIVEAHLNNPCKNIKSGMFVRASFIARIFQDVLAIPSQAIISNIDKKTVFIVDENLQATSVEVKTGFETKEDVEILSGLKAGDKVIVDGYQTLKNGSPVNIIPDKEDGL